MTSTTSDQGGRAGRWSGWVLPAQQCKPLEELADDLDLGIGDTRSKQSAFWAMLLLSALIATAGVIADSTATVIGAMIIAPLATPIMGIALGIVTGDPGLLRRSRRFVALGLVLVVVVGALASLGLPGTFDLSGNPQVTGRTSPTLADLLAAVATGFAGAIGLVRRDVSDVLPGVAVAISLVPPLAVVGVCLGQGAFAYAVGAFVLFVSNVIAMVIAGTCMFALAYRGERLDARPRRAYVTIGALMAAVVVVLAINTVVTLAVGVYEARITTVAEEWLRPVPGAEVVEVEFLSSQAVITILTPEDPPPTSELLADLKGKVPSGLDVVVAVELGQRVDAGTVD